MSVSSLLAPARQCNLAGNDANIVQNEYVNAGERNELEELFRELRQALSARGSLRPESALQQALTFVPNRGGRSEEREAVPENRRQGGEEPAEYYRGRGQEPA